MKKQWPLWRLLLKLNSKRESVSIIPECLRTNKLYLSVGKATMELVGLSGGPPRLPLEDLTDEEKQELKEVLKEMGVI